VAHRAASGVRVCTRKQGAVPTGAPGKAGRARASAAPGELRDRDGVAVDAKDSLRRQPPCSKRRACIIAARRRRSAQARRTFSV
jgi:hypothetical protein